MKTDGNMKKKWKHEKFRKFSLFDKHSRSLVETNFVILSGRLGLSY